MGQDAELSLRIMDKMTMMGPHRHQEYWWLVKMDDGRQGYVPANYVTVDCHLTLYQLYHCHSLAILCVNYSSISIMSIAV